jgi:hypothetical protein
MPLASTDPAKASRMALRSMFLPVCSLDLSVNLARDELGRKSKAAGNSRAPELIDVIVFITVSSSSDVKYRRTICQLW